MIGNLCSQGPPSFCKVEEDFKELKYSERVENRTLALYFEEFSLISLQFGKKNTHFLITFVLIRGF